MTVIGSRGVSGKVIALLTALALPALVAAAPAVAPTPRTAPKAPTAAVNPALQKTVEAEMARQRESRAERMKKGGIGIFVDKSGTPMFTNRVDKYRGMKSRFTELDVNYERITVKKEFRQLKVTNAYDVSSVSQLVELYADQWRIDRSLVYAIIKAESNFRQDARSSAGACGLMQLMPGTAAEMGVEDIFDPAENIAGGTQYIAKMLALFENDIDLALAAYNAGPKTVIDCGYKIPNISETQNYVRIVQGYKAAFEGRDPEFSFIPVNVPKPKLGSGDSGKAVRLASAKKIDSAVPKGKTIRFKSGLTQPFDTIQDTHPDYYFVTFKGKEWSVPKVFVKDII